MVWTDKFYDDAPETSVITHGKHKYQLQTHRAKHVICMYIYSQLVGSVLLSAHVLPSGEEGVYVHGATYTAEHADELPTAIELATNWVRLIKNPIHYGLSPI